LNQTIALYMMHVVALCW